MTSQAVIAVVTEQDLVLKVPVKVLLLVHVQTKMHRLKIGSCRQEELIYLCFYEACENV